jgi:hypothetical protein
VPAFHWARGDENVGFTKALVSSNCDHLKFYVNDKLVAEADPDRAQFPHLKYPPFSADLSTREQAGAICASTATSGQAGHLAQLLRQGRRSEIRACCPTTPRSSPTEPTPRASFARYRRVRRHSPLRQRRHSLRTHRPGPTHRRQSLLAGRRHRRHLDSRAASSTQSARTTAPTPARCWSRSTAKAAPSRSRATRRSRSPRAFSAAKSPSISTASTRPTASSTRSGASPDVPKGSTLPSGREHEAFERVGWDEALDAIAARLKQIADELRPGVDSALQLRRHHRRARLRLHGPPLLSSPRRQPARPHHLLRGRRRGLEPGLRQKASAPPPRISGWPS